VTAALFWGAYVAHWLLIAGWCACHWQISDARRRSCRHRERSERCSPQPRVTVVLAAKDEAANLAECGRGILAQRGVDLTLVIVDDRSTDATPRIADAIAAGDARCRVIHNAVLPNGWMGKSYACWRGVESASGDWLLFTDADVRLEPDAIASAIDYADVHQFDLFSLWLRDASRGFWERLLVPLCGAMIVVWYGHVAARSNSRGEAFANGQFLLIRRQAYQACGGHAAVKSALIEDIPLARRAARCGSCVGSALGTELAAVRMYRTAREVFRGWRRIFVGVLTPVKIVGCLLSLLEHFQFCSVA
jgi:glycosyltransferase involved in cell wall biosynthesis